MADRRRQIAALRAKADSTTFPAEAEACRAKADELEAIEPKVGFRPGVTAESFDGIGAVNDFIRRYQHVYDEAAPRPNAAQWDRLRVNVGDLWDSAGGVFVSTTRPASSERIQVTVNHPGGSSYTIWVG